MKLKINPNSINPEELIIRLKEHFKDPYTISTRKSNILVVAKGNIYGTLVFVHKDKLLVVGNFPKMLTQIIFTLLFIALGVIIPLIIYFAVIHKKMKAIEHEVTEFIKSTYSNEIITK